MKFIKSEIKYLFENFDSTDSEIVKLFEELRSQFDSSKLKIVNQKLVDLLNSVNDDSYTDIKPVT